MTQPSKHQTFTQCWASVWDDGLTLYQHWVNVSWVKANWTSLTLKQYSVILMAQCLISCVAGKTFDPSMYAVYKNNKKAWMTMLIFVELLQKLNHQMRRQNRNIILLCDNATSHKSPLLSNIQLVYLPPNTTSHIHQYIRCAESEEPLEVDVRTALEMIKTSWSDVTPTTITMLEAYWYCSAQYFWVTWWTNWSRRWPSSDQLVRKRFISSSKPHWYASNVCSGADRERQQYRS